MRYLFLLGLSLGFSICLFGQDYYPIKVSKKWGLMDQQGDIFLQPAFDAIGEFKEFGYAVMQRNGGAGVIGQSGRVIVEPRYEDIKILDSLLFAVMDKGDWKVINREGKTILEKGYEQIKLLGRKFLLFKKDRKWGVSNFNGQKMADPQFDEIDILNDNYLLTSLDGFYGLLDKDGNILLEPQQEQVQVFSESLFLYRKGKLWGGVDQNGQPLFDASFDRFRKISDAFLLLKKKSKIFLFSLLVNRIVGEEGFDEFEAFSSDKVLGTRQKKLALVDAKGQLTLSAVYDEIQLFSNNPIPLYRVRQKRKWGIFAEGDREVVSINLDHITPLNGKPVCTARMAGKFGLINKKGEELTSFDFDRIELEDKRAKAYRNGELTIYYFNEEGELEDESNYKKHFKIRFGKRRNNSFFQMDELEGTNVIGDFEWFYDPQTDKWGLRRLDDGKIQIKPTFDNIRIDRDLGMTQVGLEKMGRYNIGRTEYRFEMVYGLVNNEKGLLVTMVDMWDIRFSDFNQGSKVARCFFENGRMGLISRIGKIIIKDYAYIGDFKNGLARMSAKGRLGAEIKPGYNRLEKVRTFTSFLMAPNSMSDYTLYDRAIEQSGRLVCEECEWGYVDTIGQIVTPSTYQFARDYINDVGIVLSKKSKWGMLAPDGNVLLDCAYDGIDFLEKTNKSILRIQKNEEKYGLIDTLGQVTVNLLYDEIGAFSDDRLAVKRNGLWGFVDNEGREVIPCKYRRVNNFSESYAVVKLRNKWGLIDHQGKVIIDFNYTRLGNVQNGLLWVYTSKGIGFMDVQEQMRIAPRFRKAFDFENGVARVSEKNRFKLITPNGENISSNSFAQIEAFDENGLAIVRFKGTKVKYGLIDRTGKVVSKNKYSKVEAFEEGLAKVRINGNYGFVNEKGDLIVSAIYSQANSFSEGRAAVLKNGYWGFINKDGHEIVEFVYTKVRDFEKGKAVVYKGYQKGGIIDLEGNYIIQPGVNRLLDFSDGRGLVRDDQYRFYFITEGMDLEDAFYQQASEFQHGVAVVQLSGRWGIINKKGIEIIPPKYDKIEAFKNGYAKVRIKKFTGLSNLKGEFIVRPDYEYISYAGNGLFRVEQGDRIGYFDRGGNWIWKLSE